MKMDNGSRRKLSKRKDDEAACSYFLQDGYPADALIEYLMTIANSNFEEWRHQNSDLPLDDFKLSFDKIAFDGALFDMMKLKYFARERLSKRSAKEIVKEALEWAKVYNKELEEVILRDVSYFEKIANIEREKENPRKDYEKYSDLLTLNRFFFNDYYDQMFESAELPFNPNIDKEVIKTILKEFMETYDSSLDEQNWFASLKALGEKHKFAPSGKIYKQNKDLYLGHIGDVAEMVRITMTTSKQSPNLYWVLQILGKDEIARRIEKVLAL
jgi:glutamyl-tRNA synthetase